MNSVVDVGIPFVFPEGSGYGSVDGMMPLTPKGARIIFATGVSFKDEPNVNKLSGAWESRNCEVRNGGKQDATSSYPTGGRDTHPLRHSSGEF